MSDATPIDLDHLDRFTLGDTALEAEILSLFCQQTRMWLRVLEPSADDESWASAAHAIKGSARGVGANVLAEACDRAEALVGETARPAARSVAAGDVREAAEEALAFVEHRIHRAQFKAARPLRS